MNPALAWALLVVSGLLDVAWALSVKQSAGYSRPGWTILSFALLFAFVFLLGKAMQVLPAGTAYAVWTGIGAVGVATLGILVFGEAANALRLLGIAAIVAGVVLLKLAPA